MVQIIFVIENVVEKIVFFSEFILKKWIDISDKSKVE